MSTFRDFVPEQRFQPTLAFSPDGRRVAYSANTSGQYNLWVATLDGSEPARPLTAYTDEAVRHVAWSPDGESLAFSADRAGDEQFQISLIPAAGGDARRLTDVLDRQHALADRPFSPDGKSLVYAANDRDPMVQDVLVRDLASNDVRRIESQPGVLLFSSSISPDGRWLLAVGATSNSDSDCYLVDLADPDPALRNVTPHDGDVRYEPGPWAADSSGFYLCTNRGGEFQALAFYALEHDTVDDVEAPAWDVEQVTATDDGGTLAWSVNEAGVSVVHVRRGDESAVLPSEHGGEIAALSITPDGSTLAFLLSTATHPTDVAAVDLTSGALRYLTDSRPPALTRVRPGRPELIDFPTHDDRRIPGWQYRPAGDGPFPAVLAIHGGPEAQERAVYSYSGLYQYLLANGIGVLAPNVRGSTGYGATYQRLIERDWGGGELGDFEHAVRYLRSLDWVDAQRLAVFGGSFGGFAALSCLSRLPDLWAAGVSIVGPSNLVTLTRSVPPTWRPMMAKWVGDPDADFDFLMERSPITYADAISAPLMVIQGANDPRVVKAESDQIVASLRARGVEVRYDVYDDEGHGFTKRENEMKAIGDVGAFLVARLT